MTNSAVRAPGPKGRPILGNLPELQKDNLGFFVRLQREYGDVAVFRAGPRELYLVSHPDGIKHVLTARCYGK